jgi:hypothetical protein
MPPAAPRNWRHRRSRSTASAPTRTRSALPTAACADQRRRAPSQAGRHHPTAQAPPGALLRGLQSQRLEERGQIRGLLPREHEAERGLVEGDDVLERGGEPVVEVRKGRSKTQVLSTHCNPFRCFCAVESRRVPLGPAESRRFWQSAGKHRRFAEPGMQARHHSSRLTRWAFENAWARIGRQSRRRSARAVPDRAAPERTAARSRGRRPRSYRA